jgi:peptide/nickel transport system permease protein
VSTLTERAIALVEVPAGTGTGRRGSHSLWLFGVPLAIIVLIVLLGPLLPIPGPNTQNLDASLKPPVFMAHGSWAHPLGTDQLGQDLLSRMIYGGRLTLLLGVLGMLVAIVPGTLLGMLAGYGRGWLDVIVTRLAEAQLALPFVLVALAVIFDRGHSLGVLLFVLGITGWAQCARVVRSATLVLRERPFILALRASGLSSTRILLRHVLPNLAGTLAVLATLQIGAVILIESALSYLGVGVVPPSVSWGSVLASGQDQLQTAWWLSAFPGIAITIVVLLVNLFGDALITFFDPRKRRYA